MKATHCLVALCFLGSAVSFAQVDPSATGSTAAPGNNLVYAFRYGQAAQFSSQLATQQTSNLSATLDYQNREQRYPFSVQYGGGYIWTLSGPSYQAGQFHRLLLTQGVDFRRWKINLSDNVSYLPQSPTVGFSGIPGIGEIIGLPNPSPSTGQTILSSSTHVVDNIGSGEIEHSFSYATTGSIGGNYELLRFPYNDGININNVSGIAQLGRRISGRTTVAARALYTQHSYPGTTITISTGTALLGVHHRWTRTLSTDIAAGPQKIQSSISTLIPSSLSYAVNGGLNYQRRLSEFDANYSHGTNGGSGYLIGGTIDMLNGNLTHQFGPNSQVGFMGGFNRTSALNGTGATTAEYGGMQGTWRVAGNLILFANYSVMNQSSSLSLPGTVLTDLRNIIGFGFGYSSREVRLRR